MNALRIIAAALAVTLFGAAQAGTQQDKFPSPVNPIIETPY